MRAVDIIMKKRQGGELEREEIAHMISGYVSGEIPDYQISAWLMAIFFRGMVPRETADLTELMLRSGKVMDLSGIPGPFVDKHSTGGVGDKVSLILAPMVAACGVKVPMMSGRALGHTGGTLDKLESIPGYKTGLTEKLFREYIARDGFAMTGQTAEIVPADKKLYALRDVTATVESIPLITASILSK
ncbi:MAG: thymidine phosphorylase, partial [Spirochaetaceae bacterium]|nr:thymidine phosphorylase [Spirochaetaceae bacterium]